MKQNLTSCIEPCKIFDGKNCLLSKLHSKINSKYIFKILPLPVKYILEVCVHKSAETMKVVNSCGHLVYEIELQLGSSTKIMNCSEPYLTFGVF